MVLQPRHFLLSQPSLSEKTSLHRHNIRPLYSRYLISNNRQCLRLTTHFNPTLISIPFLNLVFQVLRILPFPATILPLYLQSVRVHLSTFLIIRIWVTQCIQIFTNITHRVQISCLGGYLTLPLLRNSRLLPQHGRKGCPCSMKGWHPLLHIGQWATSSSNTPCIHHHHHKILDHLAW